MYIIYYFIALHLTLTRSFSSFYRWNNYMPVFGRTRPFAVKVSGKRKPGESCINPHLWVRLSGPPTSPHHNHPADPRTGGHQGPPLYRGGMRFTVLSCFFSRGKGKSIILTRKGAGVALSTWEQRNGPQPKPGLTSTPRCWGRTRLAPGSSQRPQRGTKTEKLWTRLLH